LRLRVAIVGGGLAGIAAALQLADADYQPIIIESRKMLGGRATSVVDPRNNQLIDNCQHVLMGCCTNLIDLYDRLGVIDTIQWHKELYWTMSNGEIDTVKANRLPAPLHLARAFAKMRFLNANQRKQIQKATWRIIRLGSKGRFKWRDRTFIEFLKYCKQDESTIRMFWDVVITSACNLDVKRVSAAHAIQVFQQGFLANRWSYTMGLATVPLVELYSTVEKSIEAVGGEIQFSTSAKAISFDGSRVTGVVTSSDFVEASAVIAAVPPDRLEKLVSHTIKAADNRLQALDQFQTSPILGVHLWFDQQVMDLPHLVIADSGVQWLFNKGTDDQSRQHLHAVISAADSWMELTEQEIVKRVMEDIHRALPNSIGIEPIQARSIKEKRATFAATPEIENYRPSAAASYVGVGGGGIKNLYLAGDWCDTGWPATMEGAVRSGYAAALQVTGQGGVVADVPSSFLARLLGLR